MLRAKVFQALILSLVFTGNVLAEINSQIVEGGLFGLISGVLIIPTMLVLIRSKKTETANKKFEKIMSKVVDANVSTKKPFLDRWSVKLALFGMGLGGFATMSLGYINIWFMIGIGVPIALTLGIVGLIIDFIKNRKK